MKDQIKDAEIVEDEDVAVDEAGEEEQPSGEIESDDVSEDDKADDQKEDEGDIEDESDTLVVEIAGEDDPEETPVIRTLRQKARDAAKKVKELERKLEEKTATEQAAELGPKPKLEEFDYDEDKFAEALTEWTARKSESDAVKAKEAEAQKQAEAEWNDRIAVYNERKQKLGAHDFDEAEDVVKTGLSVTQQSIIVDAAMSPEVVVYAVGKNPDVLERLSKISSPIRFAAEIARLETKMKVSGMKSKPAPESRPKDTKAPTTGKAQLEKLRAKAERSGDFTAYYAAKRKTKG